MYLHLEGNKLTQFPSSDTLAHIPKLLELHLERNLIVKLEPSGLLSPVPQLSGLYLNNNIITSIVPKALDPAPKLDVLHLEANALTEVPSDALGHAPLLSELRLSGNPIRWIGPRAFRAVAESLKHLHIDRMSLQKVEVKWQTTWDNFMHYYRDSSPKNSVINYSPSRLSKPVRPSFIFRTHIKIFLMKSESFLTLPETARIRTWSRPRKVVRILLNQWINCNYMKLQEYFLCTKKTKITTLFNNSSFLCQSSTCIFLGLDRVSCVAVYARTESSWTSSKISSFVFWRWTKVLWVGNDIINTY